ncbi:MAG TPA: Bax inhibitor-1 family protein [Acidimicrobiales bacterium]|nr:Bax inhibitor-1 family protein [Acidimicrobiales bacterium]
MSAAPIGYRPVASHDDTVRTEFLARVYQHLGLALAAFVAFEVLLFELGIAKGIYDFVARSGGAWLLMLGAFMVISWIATNAAHDILNPQRQYLGLFGIAAGQALIFAPWLYFFFNVHDNGSADVVAAGIITAIGFAGLTLVAMVTRKDLSFLRPIILFGMFMALALIVGAVVFGMDLGVWFSVAMIALAGGSILYQTQTIMRRYPPEAYVGASVQLFASVMLLFWYVLRLFARR